MPKVLLGEGISISHLPQMEARLPEGSTGELRLYLENPVTQSEIDTLQENLSGVLTGPIHQVSRVLIIPYRKSFGPLLLIIAALALIPLVVLGWQLFKSLQNIPLWVWLAAAGLVTYVAVKL